MKSKIIDTILTTEEEAKLEQGLKEYRERKTLELERFEKKGKVMGFPLRTSKFSRRDCYVPMGCDEF